MTDEKHNPDAGPGIAHAFDCTHDPCTCASEQSSVGQFGPIPPVPEPFWHRTWRTLFRWRPECIPCGRRFRDEAAWRDHYLDTHVRREAR